MAVKWEKRNSDGYEIAYSTSKSFKKVKKITVSGKTSLNKTVKSLASKKRYYVKIRAFKKLDGKKVYGYYSKVKSVVIK